MTPSLLVIVYCLRGASNANTFQQSKMLKGWCLTGEVTEVSEQVTVIAYRHTAVCCHVTAAARSRMNNSNTGKRIKADPPACYRAANGKFLGLITGCGKNGQTYKQNRRIKQVLAYH